MENELLERFKELDVNGDGFITMEEMKKVFEQEGQKWDERDAEIFREVDQNADGKISIKGIFFSILHLTIFSFIIWMIQNGWLNSTTK